MSVERICLHCGKAFAVRPSAVARGKGVYCSPACRYTHLKTPLAVRFWRYVEKTDTCWLWTGAVQASGHGVMNRGAHSGVVRVHRVSWELHVGPIPAGMEVCHKCDVPNCVNPAHLFLGTQLDNLEDMRRKGRHARGEKTGQSRLTEADVIEIRNRYAAGGIRHIDLAVEYGVKRQTISDIVTRRRWAHVP